MRNHKEILEDIDRHKWIIDSCRKDPLGIDQMVLFSSLQSIKDLEKELSDLHKTEEDSAVGEKSVQSL